MLLQVSVGLLIAVVITVVVFYFKKLLEKPQGYPLEDVIEGAIMPYLYNAIMLAFKQSEKHYKEFGRILDGVDKKALADYVYNMLPDHIRVGKYMIPITFIKSVITRERFASLVESVYVEFKRWYDVVWEKYGDELGLEDEVLGATAKVAGDAS